MQDHESRTDAAPLRDAQPPDLGPFCCPLPRLDVLNTRDQRVGAFDGLLLSAASDKPRYLVVQRDDPDGQRRLIPIGSAWFDQTTKAIRVDDADVSRASELKLEEFERITPQEVAAFERRVLASCCPEVLRDAAAAPEYETSPQFTCPEWLKA